MPAGTRHQRGASRPQTLRTGRARRGDIVTPFAPVQAVKYMRHEYEAMRLPVTLRAGIDRRNAEALFPRLKEQL